LKADETSASDRPPARRAKAHTTRGPIEQWEDLFTPFGELDPDDPSAACSGRDGSPCTHCENLDPKHGHLNKVAWWTAKFAAEMFPENSESSMAAKQWGYLAGLWHDLGKFSEEFQARLRDEISRANHSTAGAQFAHRRLPMTGQLLAYMIAGHHAGLANLIGGESSLRNRIAGHDFVADLPAETSSLLTADALSPVLSTGNPRAHAVFTRLLFSCLVDADFLATEGFMAPAQTARRPDWPDDILAQMETALANRYAQFDRISPSSSDIARRRAAVHSDCLSAAERPPGLFTLTVPTGGGKTLASLAFALDHARRHGLRHVIYVVPFTSIIEQNAGEYRDTFAALAEKLGRDPVLEHHSNFETPDDDKAGIGGDEKPLWRLAAENWDAPLVVTPSVQFFESLYANKTSRCRKLHRIARSVIVFDEVQTLPPEFLKPCLDALEHLTKHFGSTAVLCTATQPAVGQLDPDQPGDFAKKFNKIALDLADKPGRKVEIIGDVPALFVGLSRTSIADLGSLTDEQLAAALRDRDRALCILNTKPHAARVFEFLGEGDPANIHLSAQLCPAHRATVLEEIRRRERAGEPCRVIATTVVEAGVDIDFPVVFRALTGLDSLAQAAGRCNRHGKLAAAEGNPIRGSVFLFTPADQKTPRFLTQNVNATACVLPDYRECPDDLILPTAITAYFRQFYFEKGNWDKQCVCDCFKFANDSREFPFHFNFKTAAQNFQLIPDTQLPVIIDPKPDTWPGQDEIKSAEIRALIDKLRSANRYGHPPPSNAHRKLQRYTVQIPKPIHAAMVAAGTIEPLCESRFPILVHPENDYDSNTGLLIPNHANHPEAFMV